ncbi:hypothetical protein RP20_CCG014435 [Aedes albopictus]|nr:hypothetical protein RP20_CCG014435 [Aedes albopictus]
MPSEAKKTELYLLLLQSSTALLIALVNTLPTLRHDVQLTIKKRLLQLVKTLWEFLKDEAVALEHHSVLDQSHGYTDLSLEFQRASETDGRPRYSPLSSTMIDKSATEAIGGTRFPMIHRLLAVLARNPDEEVFARTVQPFMHAPNFQRQLRQEMTAFRRMLTDDDASLYLGEPALTQRLDRMELSMRRIMLQLNALINNDG